MLYLCVLNTRKLKSYNFLLLGYYCFVLVLVSLLIVYIRNKSVKKKLVNL